MPDAIQGPPPPCSPILAEAEATRRIAFLTELQNALEVHGICSVLAKTRRLVLRYNTSPQEPSGPTNPQLHILSPHGTNIATTDGTTYHFTSGKTYPTSDPTAAAAAARSDQRRAARRPKDAALRAWI